MDLILNSERNGENVVFLSKSVKYLHPQLIVIIFLYFNELYCWATVYVTAINDKNIYWIDSPISSVANLNARNTITSILLINARWPFYEVKCKKHSPSRSYFNHDFPFVIRFHIVTVVIIIICNVFTGLFSILYYFISSYKKKITWLKTGVYNFLIINTYGILY